MTNFEKIKSLSIEEFAGWIDSTLPFSGNEPWNKWFNEEYCKKCEPETVLGNGLYYPWGTHETEIECSFCEINGYCRFFPYYNSPLDTKDVITMWLNKEEEEQHL